MLIACPFGFFGLIASTHPRVPAQDFLHLREVLSSLDELSYDAEVTFFYDGSVANPYWFYVGLSAPGGIGAVVGGGAVLRRQPRAGAAPLGEQWAG